MSSDERNTERAALSVHLRTTLSKHGVTQQEVADATGARATVVQRWCDPDHTAQLGVADARRMPAEVAVELARWLLDPHGYVPAERGGEVEVVDDMAHAADVMRSGGDLSREYLDSIRDNYFSPDEADRVIDRARTLVQFGLAAEQRALQVKRTRGDGVRSRVPMPGPVSVPPAADQITEAETA